jgi:OFA family oxalate/formate antiporter-like MFS transporter
MVYGAMLTAWGIAGVVGPQLISYIRDSTGEYTSAFYIIAGIMLVSAIIPFIVRPPAKDGEPPERARFRRETAPTERAGTR